MAATTSNKAISWAAMRRLGRKTEMSPRPNARRPERGLRLTTSKTRLSSHGAGGMTSSIASTNLCLSRSSFVFICFPLRSGP